MQKIITAIALAIGGLMYASSAMLSVDQRHYAIVFSFGEFQRKIDDAGLHFKLPSPFETVLFLDKRINTIDTPDAQEFLTKEKMNVLVDSFVKWRIVDPVKFYRTFNSLAGQRAIDSKVLERSAQDQLSVLIKTALNEEITLRTVDEVVSGARTGVTQGIIKRVADETKQMGIEIVDVRLKRVDFSEKVSESVFNRMRREREQEAVKIRSDGEGEKKRIMAEADKKVAVILSEAYKKEQEIKGDGDAQATAIFANASTKNPEFFIFYRNLEAYRKSFDQNRDTLVIDSSSEFFKHMRQSGAVGK